jgi:hypothetical protein
MTRSEHYDSWLKELVRLRHRINATETEREIPTKLYMLVLFAAEEAATQLQASREPSIDQLPPHA